MCVAIIMADPVFKINLEINIINISFFNKLQKDSFKYKRVTLQ